MPPLSSNVMCKKMKSLPILILFFSSCAFANENYEIPIVKFAPNEYHITSKEALKLFNKEEYKESIQYFEKALSCELYEVPNFKIIPFLAYSHCKVGNKEKGRVLLRDFQCMLEIDGGEKQCYTGKIGTKDIIWNIDSIPEKCFKTMCTEEFESYYKNNQKTHDNYYSKFQSLIESAIDECENK